jgi:glycine/betaine/sarcosine/D-proline reductase family selenoprotein B
MGAKGQNAFQGKKLKLGKEFISNIIKYTRRNSMDINKTVQFMRKKVDPDFNFVNNTDKVVPFTKLDKKIKDSKLVLISSGGFHLSEDEPFDTEDSFGDPSYRVIPKNTNLDTLEISHAHYDHKYVNQDLNCAFPLELLKELERKEKIGSLANNHYSFMGYCLKTEKLKENARELADILKKNGVETALIAPT